LGTLINKIPKRALDFAQKGVPVSRLEDKLKKLAARLEYVEDINQLYESLISEWSFNEGVVLGADDHVLGWRQPDSILGEFGEMQHGMMVYDSLTYLPDDILHKVDRAGMGVSLETRVPFLDPDVVETAWRIPLGMKLRKGQSKWILRQILNRHVPHNLTDRPKAGFAMPTGEWLRGPLRPWLEDLLNNDSLKRDGYFDPKPIAKKILQHMDGTHDWTNALWAIIMFQTWKDEMKVN
jgi:asparagine synthase (glutamine-hydrolysing)